MADTKQAWHEVADQFSDLGLKLKLHFDETVQARPDDSVKKALAIGHPGAKFVQSQAKAG